MIYSINLWILLLLSFTSFSVQASLWLSPTIDIDLPEQLSIDGKIKVRVPYKNNGKPFSITLDKNESSRSILAKSITVVQNRKQLSTLKNYVVISPYSKNSILELELIINLPAIQVVNKRLVLTADRDTPNLVIAFHQDESYVTHKVTLDYPKESQLKLINKAFYGSCELSFLGVANFPLTALVEGRRIWKGQPIRLNACHHVSINFKPPAHNQITKGSYDFSILMRNNKISKLYDVSITVSGTTRVLMPSRAIPVHPMSDRYYISEEFSIDVTSFSDGWELTLLSEESSIPFSLVRLDSVNAGRAPVHVINGRATLQGKKSQLLRLQAIFKLSGNPDQGNYEASIHLDEFPEDVLFDIFVPPKLVIQSLLLSNVAQVYKPGMMETHEALAVNITSNFDGKFEVKWHYDKTKGPDIYITDGSGAVINLNKRRAFYFFNKGVSEFFIPIYRGLDRRIRSGHYYGKFIIHSND